ncbi:hypothetical protein Q5P01_022067 [Channa striata]|uniref:Uncharacterized protein n=1 Tax=Channa striata TaxID=64152 RepID=A0AA88JC70_CHASR|nr:hypothetical protein Q5P01_022067 [Channa striata]
MGMLVNSAVHKTKGSLAENSRPEKKVKTEDAESTDISAARHTSSSGFLVNLLVVPMDGSHWVAWLEPLLCPLLYWHFDQISYQFLGEDVGIARVL